MHSSAVSNAKKGLADAEQQMRAERERQRTLERELEQTKSTTTTTSTNAKEKLEGVPPGLLLCCVLFTTPCGLYADDCVHITCTLTRSLH